MVLRDLHVHTVFSDGADTPEAVVRAALSMGMETLGFSDHAHTAFDESYCMKKEQYPAYRAEITALKEQYREGINILCGIEQDYYSDLPTDGFDYVIGSVHYIRTHGEYVPVDESADILRGAADQHFGGDLYALAEAYFDTVADVVEKTHADIIGHFDLINKFGLFDAPHPRYQAAWKKAADALLETGVPFEINTGAISRGYRTVPYPASEIRAYLEENGASFLPASDSHRADTLCFGFAGL